MLTVLAFAILSSGHSTLAHHEPNPDSVFVRKFIARARLEETHFIAAWRREWQGWRDLRSTDPRYFSIHCHYDEPLRLRQQHHLIRTVFSQKSMCPIWFQGQGERADEAIAIDNGIPPKAREKIRQRRARVIQLLDSAAMIAPRDEWVLGQRVRMNVDQERHVRALSIAATECHASPATCAMLEGYVLYSAGNQRDAAVTFDYAVSVMDGGERCRFLDVAAFVPWGQRDRYEALSCEQRGEPVEGFWWLADPLFADPGNERLAVHLYRHMLVALKAALPADEHFDYRLRYGGAAVAEMLLRYGWPNVSYYHRGEDEAHYRWLGWRDGAANASREYFMPRYHTVPSWDVAADLAGLGANEFLHISPPWDSTRMDADRGWWPIEHFERRGALRTLDHQSTAFRRERGGLIAVATDPRTRAIADAWLPDYTASLVAMRGPRDTARVSSRTATIGPGGGVVMTIETVPGWQVLSGEIWNAEDAATPAARTRFPATIAPGLDALRPGEVALSDPALFSYAPDDSLPRTSAAAIERMLPTTWLGNPERIGVYFEIYGLSPAATADLTLTIVALDQPGLLRRIGARFGIAESGGGALAVRWRGNHPGTASSLESSGDAMFHTRAIVLNMALLRSGRYALEIGMDRGGDATPVARREFTVAR